MNLTNKFRVNWLQLLIGSIVISAGLLFTLPTGASPISTGKVSTVKLTDMQSPTPPNKAWASDIQAMQVVLNWTAATDNRGVTSYLVYQGNSLVAELPAFKRQMTVTSLNQLTVYSFTVKAKDAEGNISKNSNIVYLKTLRFVDLQAPSQPYGVKLTNLTSTSLTITWMPSTDNVDVSYYVIYNIVKNKTKVLAIVPAIMNEHKLTGLKANTYLGISIVAKDASNNASKPSTIIKTKTYSASEWKVVQEATLRKLITLSVSDVDVNFAGGVTFTTKINNLSLKTIKYVYLKSFYFNPVGDVLYDDITGEYVMPMRAIGPIFPVDTGIYDWDKSLFYNNMTSEVYVKITSVEFMDGTILNY
jgi:hypothetical protein